MAVDDERRGRDGHASGQHARTCPYCRGPPVHYNDDVRRRLRLRGEPIELELALTERERDVRMTVPTVATECYDTLPARTAGWYLPGEHAIILDLPAPESIDDGERQARLPLTSQP